MMPEKVAFKSIERLTLQSRMAELGRVWPWVDSMAAEYLIPADTHFAIHLCLEEALSNIIRHGYRGQPDRTINLGFTVNGSSLSFIIEDQAPHFAPPEPEAAQPPAGPASLDDLASGGQGIRLMRRFADTLAWEELPRGNQLTIGFRVERPASGSAAG
jgi:serine/threonine-protein kinase RsbW